MKTIFKNAKYNKLALCLFSSTLLISIPITAKYCLDKNLQTVHAKSLSNNSIKKINKTIGNDKFEIFDSSSNGTEVFTHGDGITTNLISASPSESSLLGAKVVRVKIPDNIKPGSKVSITYDSGVRYGNHKLSVKLTLTNLINYKNNAGMGNLSGKRYIDISKSVYKGLFYYGITKAHAHYSFYDEKGNDFNIGGQSSPSYMTFNSLNGVDASTSFKAVDKRVGEWVRYVNDDDPVTGYVSNPTGLGVLPISNLTGINGEKAIGGRPYTPFHDSQIGNQSGKKDSFESHSVTFPAYSRGYQDFEFGASYGSAWYALSTRGLKKPPKPDIPDDKNNQENGEKSVSKSEIKKQGEEYYYNISGNLPEKHKTYKTNYYQAPVNKRKWVFDSKDHKKGHYENYTVYETRSYKSEINRADSYTVSDNVSKDLSVKSVNAQGINVSRGSGNQLTFTADNAYLLRHSNGHYNIRINVKADHLPKPDKTGFHDKGVHEKGWYYINNKAHINVKRYNKVSSHDTNNVKTRIKRIQGVVYHFDRDSDESGDFSFKNTYDDVKKNNFSNNDNFDEDNGVIKKENIYGYNNDKKDVNVLKNAYKENNNEWKYRYAFGNQDKEQITLKDNEEDGGSDYRFSRDYFLPYIVPRASLGNAVIKIDTDKGSNNLPFQIIMNGTSDMYREFSDYGNSQVNVSATDNNGHTLFNESKSLNSLVQDNEGSSSYTLLKGVLNTKNLNLNKGQKLPVTVRIQATNPNQIIIDHDSQNNTFGFTSSENTMVGNKDENSSKAKNDGNPLNNQPNSSYFKKDENSYTAPERTLKYDNVDSVRVLSEQLKLTQHRYASAKSGLGMRNDLVLDYRGNLHSKDYMNNGTALNYVFPNEFKKETNIKYSQDNHNHKFNGNNMSIDRLNQVNSYQSKNESFNDLDNTNSMDSNDQQVINSTDSNLPSYMKDENYGQFKTDYQFYPRVSEYNSGNINLAKGVEEPRPANDDGKPTAFNFFNGSYFNDDAMDNHKFRDGGNKFYTPNWLKLKDYPIYFDKTNGSNTNKDQLGGNWMNINELRPVKVYAHNYLAAQSDSGINESQDQLSIQPILSQQQKVKGFSNFENNWLYFKH